MIGSERQTAARDGGPRRRSGRQAGAAGAAVSGAGAALVATAASACCVPIAGPLIVALLGASGAAWAAGLKPYGPWLLGGSFLLLAYGFWSAYRVPRRCDAQPAVGGRRWTAGVVRGILWLAALLWLAAVAVNLFFEA